MSVFPIPDLPSAVQRVRAAFAAAMPGLNAWLWPNTIGPTAKVIGGEVWNVMNRLDYVGRQAFALYAEGQYLDYHGSELNLPRRQAAAATGNVVIATPAAIAVASGAQFQRADGSLFAATAAASIAGAGALTVSVVGAAGQAGNTAPLSPVTIVSGVSGAGSVAATAAVDGSGLSGGADVEPDGPPKSSSLATYRGRILFRKRNPPLGGAPSDYVQWASAVAGVTRVYVEKVWAGPGTVRVFPLFDEIFAASGGIPDPAHLALVQNALAMDVPAGAALTVAAPVAQPISLTVSGLNPSTSEVQAAVIAELKDLFQRLGVVSGSNDPNPSMPFLASPQVFKGLWIKGAVNDAAGVISADVHVPDTPIAFGSMATLGSVIFA